MNSRKNYTLVFVAIIIGLLLTYLSGYRWEWFARSGAAITIFGIVLFWRDISGVLAVSESMISRELQNIDATVEKITGPSVSTEERRRGEIIVQQVLEEIKVSLSDMIRNRERIYKKNEKIILLIGAIIWGFGGALGDDYSWVFGLF